MNIILTQKLFFSKEHKRFINKSYFRNGVFNNKELRFSMINKVATTHCSALKREDISTNAECDKGVIHNFTGCFVSRDVCIVSN
jgi:hypothetical protein